MIFFTHHMVKSHRECGELSPNTVRSLTRQSVNSHLPECELSHSVRKTISTPVACLSTTAARRRCWNRIWHILSLWTWQHWNIIMIWKMVEDQGSRYFAVVRNIPKTYHSADLRRFFSRVIEENVFSCFHYKHRPEGKPFCFLYIFTDCSICLSQ